MLNILGAPLQPDKDGLMKSVLMDTYFMEKTNHSTVAQAVNACLHDFEVDYNDISVFNTDNAQYMKKTYTDVLRNLYPYSVHITCVAHCCNLIGDAFKKPFHQVNEFVKSFNAMFWHAGARKARYLRYLAAKGKPPKMAPNPISTR